MRLAALLLLLAGCRVFMPEKYAARDRCARRLPLYRGEQEPDRRYRVIQLLRAANEDQLAYKACSEGADALIHVRYTEELSVRTSGSASAIGRTTVGGSISRVSAKQLIYGSAVRWVD